MKTPTRMGIKSKMPVKIRGNNMPKLPILKNNPLYRDINTDINDKDITEDTKKTMNEKNKTTKEEKRAEKAEKKRRNKEFKEYTEDIKEKLEKNNKEQTSDLLGGMNKGFAQLIDVMKELKELMAPKPKLFEDPVVWQISLDAPATGQKVDETPSQLFPMQ